ncbi:Short chain dehydrogenase citE-like protein [Cladobotryum mycophilum]|uniref:Short chain dehydrogenase citE-like protein n=1 Tax=Cladobotryum mycophilum TaxID=491253 RepID=A0ABR0SPY3_9HYPO
MLPTPWRYLVPPDNASRATLTSEEALALAKDKLMHHQLFTSTIHHDVYSTIDPSSPELTQVGRVVLITEATSPIAAEHARYFAKAGARAIILTSRRMENLEALRSELATKYPSTEVGAAYCSFTLEEEVAHLLGNAISKFGSLDVIISCAAPTPSFKKIGESDMQEWWRDLETGVKPLFMLSRFAANLTGTPVTLINVTSVTGLETIPTRSNYAIGQSVGCQHPNIRAFNLHPGYVAGDGQAGRLESTKRDTPTLSAGVSLYLTTPQADFLRGRFMSANWDIADLEERKEEIVGQNLLTTYLRTNVGPGGHLT